MELEKRYSETHETWNKVAQLYEEKFMDLDFYNATYDRFCALLNNDKAKILELGCGPGNITKYILERYPNFEILGTDISENMVKIAQKNNPNAQFKVMDCRDMKELSATYDAIVCGFILPYLSPKDSDLFFENCYSILNESGILYLSFVEGDFEKSGYISGSSGDRTYFYYYEIETLESVLAAQNLKIMETIKVAYPRGNNEEELHTILLIEKK